MDPLRVSFLFKFLNQKLLLFLRNFQQKGNLKTSINIILKNLRIKLTAIAETIPLY
jgi:hypothetical protein